MEDSLGGLWKKRFTLSTSQAIEGACLEGQKTSPIGGPPFRDVLFLRNRRIRKKKIGGGGKGGGGVPRGTLGKSLNQPLKRGANCIGRKGLLGGGFGPR